MIKTFPSIKALCLLTFVCCLFSTVAMAQLSPLAGNVEQLWLASSKITSKGQASSAAKSAYGGKVLSVSQSKNEAGTKVFVVKILKQGKVIFVMVTEDGQTSRKG